MRAHRLLIIFPLGLLATSFFFDVAWLVNEREPLARAAAVMLAGGVFSGAFAALFGIADWRAIPEGTRAKRIGAMHGIGNVIVILLFAASWIVRRNEPAEPHAFAIALSAGGVLLTLGTAWLGGTLIERADRGENEDRRESLSPTSTAVR
ncbi:MAG TPA: DUF2231 domain-containing protein [Thermoanaerobaculia bacterium]|nr:DUF2231 domain-containing protein [Thermoanaerobaculia bacterium]